MKYKYVIIHLQLNIPVTYNHPPIHPSLVQNDFLNHNLNYGNYHSLTISKLT